MATILVIDDQETMRLIFKFELERAGYPVLTAEHGKHGLRVLEQEETDLILVDIFMPDVDGLELIARLRKKKRLGIKIIEISEGYQTMSTWRSIWEQTAHSRSHSVCKSFWMRCQLN